MSQEIKNDEFKNTKLWMYEWDGCCCEEEDEDSVYDGTVKYAHKHGVALVFTDYESALFIAPKDVLQKFLESENVMNRDDITPLYSKI